MKSFYCAMLLISITLSSCSLLQSKEDKLTKDEWILYSRFISSYANDKSESKMIFYKKSEKELVLKFNSDGTVRISEKNGEKFATIDWKWKSDNNEYITLDTGTGTSDFHILKLNNNMLTWSKSEIYSDTSTLETFKHLDDSDWDDSMVEEMNK